MTTTKKTKNGKWKAIGAIAGTIMAIVVGVWQFEDRYFTIAKAQDMEIRLVQSLKQFQMQQNTMVLDDLYRRKMLYERLLEKFPYDNCLVREYENINKEIKEMRERIRRYNQ